MLTFDCVVIGAGAAGMTAAIYLKRAGMNVVLLERNAPGGQINKTAEIENYPGFVSIDGPSLAMLMFEQVTKLEIPYEYGNVLKIESFGDHKIITTDVDTITCKSIVIASGRIPNKLNLEGEDQLVNHGISWCALCDGAFYKNKVVGVVGSGNSALEEGIYLSEIASKVIMLNRGDHFKGSKIAEDKLMTKHNIEIHYNTSIQTLNSMNDNLSSVIVSKNGSEEEIQVDGLFLYIGYQPDSNFLSSLPIELENQYVVVDKNMKTNIDHIYACGDIIKKDIYQIATAVGEAAIAAMQAQKEL